MWHPSYHHRAAYGVEPICKVLPIAPSTYRAHVARRIDPSRLPERAKRDTALTIEIRRVFEANFRVYGVRLRPVRARHAYPHRRPLVTQSGGS